MCVQIVLNLSFSTHAYPVVLNHTVANKIIPIEKHNTLLCVLAR